MVGMAARGQTRAVRLLYLTATVYRVVESWEAGGKLILTALPSQGEACRDDKRRAISAACAARREAP
jgi:hypothetical protein